MFSPRWSLSTWSLHGRITSGLSLLDLPAQIASRGIHTLELCHFHLPSTERSYLNEFRGALREAGVTLYSLLIDTGDITAPDVAERENDCAMIRNWIEVAAAVGAGSVRIDAGRQPPTDEVIALSAANLQRLASFARGLGLGTFTENWHETSRQPRPLLEILDRCGESSGIGLCADTGNAEGPEKYETLALLLPRATSMHFHFKPADPTHRDADRNDIARVVGLMRAADFAGPVSLIYSGTEDEWEVVECLKRALEPHFPAGPR